MSFASAPQGVLPGRFTYVPTRGLTFNGISRAAPDAIKSWCLSRPSAKRITDHATNPQHQAPAIWWDAQAQLYGIAYNLNPGADAIEEAVYQLSLRIDSMATFKPVKKIEPIEACLRSLSPSQMSFPRLLPSNAPTQGVSMAPTLSNLNLPTQSMIATASNSTPLGTNSNNTSQLTTVAIPPGPSTTPPRQGLKRKDQPEYSDDDSSQGPALKLRRTNDLQGVEAPSRASPNARLTLTSAPSSYDIVRSQWLKLRSSLPAPLPKAEAPMIASLCKQCEKHVRACKCKVCPMCWDLEEACACEPCIICRQKECMCTICMECMEKKCPQVLQYCQCYCNICKSKYRVLTPKLTDNVCLCDLTVKTTMQTRLSLLKTLEKRKSEGRQLAITALTDQLSTDWLAENIPDYFTGAPIEIITPKALDSFAGIYELYWNDWKVQHADRLKLVIEIDDGVAWACCLWGTRITSMIRMERVPSEASTVPVGCRIAYAKGLTVDAAWSFEHLKFGSIITTRDAHVGEITVLGDSLLLLDPAVVGMRRSLYPSAIFGVKVAGEKISESIVNGNQVKDTKSDQGVDETESKHVELSSRNDDPIPANSDANAPNADKGESRIEGNGSTDKEGGSAIRKVWNMKHQRYCECGIQDEEEANKMHDWGQGVKGDDDAQWDEEFIDKEVAKLMDDPGKEYCTLSRLFVGIGEV